MTKRIFTKILLLAIAGWTPATYGFDSLPAASFDSLSAFSLQLYRTEGNAKHTQDGETVKYDRAGYRYYFSFAPVEKFAFVLEGSRANLGEIDKDYRRPAGPKNERKHSYSRDSLGLRTTFFNEEGSPVKVGIHSDIILNDTRDQDGESFAVTPFLYIGNQLPLSFRYAYSTEYARKNVSNHEADVGSMDTFYASHAYLRFDPYHSVMRVPVGYEYYYRSGIAPDVRDFDTHKSNLQRHRLFFYLPNEAELFISAETADGMTLNMGITVPFF